MKKILLIEDNPEMRENTAEILEFSNFEVTTAENGRIGVAKAREFQPDLILCDIMMPELDGYGVLHLLGRDPATAGIPFVFLSAKAERSDVRKGMQLGADDYLTKPFEEMELLEAIEARFKRSEIVRKEYADGVAGLDNFMDDVRATHALKELSEGRRAKTYRPKEEIFGEGDLARDLYYIVSGKVKAWRMNDDGKELVTGLAKAGEYLGYLGLLSGGHYKQSASALEKTEVALIPREDFEALMWKNRDVAFRFVKLLANSVEEKEKQLLHLAYDSVRSRVAEVLLHLKQRYEKEGENEFHIRIARDDLAAMAGTATESLIRTLTEFKTDGLIENRGREIILKNIAGLERVKRIS